MLRHLVVALPGAAFASNRDVATFVAQLLGDDPLAGPYAVAKVQDLSLSSLRADQCIAKERDLLGFRWCVQQGGAHGRQHTPRLLAGCSRREKLLRRHQRLQQEPGVPFVPVVEGRQDGCPAAHRSGPADRCRSRW